MSKYTAEVIVEMLENAGIRHIWGITGDTANHVTSAIDKSQIAFMHVRHQETAAFAAGAEANATGRLSACIGSCGPGSLHLLNGLYDANANRAPVICLVTDIQRDEAGFEYVHEIQPKKIFSGCSVFCEYVHTSLQLPRLMASAIQHAISKRGVAVLIVPGDITARIFDGGDYTQYKPFYTSPRITPAQDDLFRIAELINASSRLAIIAGEGCKDAHDEVMRLSELRKAAVAWTYYGKQYAEYDNPYAVGLIGTYGTNSVNETLRSCDLLLQLGSQYNSDDYKISGKVLQIDADPQSLGVNHYVDFAFEGNIKDTLALVLPLINEQKSMCYIEEVMIPYENKIRQYEELYHKKVTSANEIYSEYLFNLLDRRCSWDAAFCADTGSALVLMQRHIHAGESRMFFHSGRWGSMGNALPTALGVKAAYSHKQVIALCGDGGLSSLLGDLITAVQLKLPVKIVLLNNGKLDFTGLEFYQQKLLPANIDLRKVDFAAIATAIGFAAYHVTHASELESAIDRWLDQDQPAFLDVKVASITNLHNGLIKNNL
ncbi:MAG: thiamine pyrophosphate-dependent enzyme [Bacteroidales bacterium]